MTGRYLTSPLPRMADVAEPDDCADRRVEPRRASPVEHVGTAPQPARMPRRPPPACTAVPTSCRPALGRVSDRLVAGPKRRAAAQGTESTVLWAAPHARAVGLPAVVWMGTTLRAFLKEWQALIAALITASAAFITAFLVGRLNRRREENAAAMALVTDLAALRLMAENVRRIQVPAALLDDRAEPLNPVEIVSVCNQITRAPRVPLSPLFDGHVARVSAVDEILASLLHRIRHEYLVIQQRLGRIERVGLPRAAVDASFRHEVGLTT